MTRPTIWFMSVIPLCFYEIACFSQHVQKPTPSENFPYHIELDPNSKFHLFWKYNETHIIFEAHVRTTGYVGLGLSPNGKMFPADVVIGWVADGTTYFQDRHTLGHKEPIIDKSQDWFLLHGEENDFGTVLKMVRKLDTCDDQDFRITEDTIRVIYSFDSVDPSSNNGLLYHGVSQRGTRSLMLLSQIETPPLPSDAVTRDLLNGQYSVPGTYTTYHCRIFDFSDFNVKHHMVKFEPYIQQGHETLVHHMLLHRCPGVDQGFVGTDYDCYKPQNASLQPCGYIFVCWAIGGAAFYFPEDVGMPFGGPDDNAVYILETHYDNPELRTDFVDNSGLRITYTPTLRQHEAGLLAAGMATHPFVIIPPYEESFVASSICKTGCLNRGLASKSEGINVFAVLHHGHLIAEGVKTRHIRKGVELKPLAADDHYDFDYQDYKHLHQPRSFVAGDSLIVECTYDSSKRKNVTHGGLSSLEEMCLSFIYYYPRMDVEMCMTLPMYNSSDISDYQNIINFYKVDYSEPANRQMFKDIVADSNYLEMCFVEGSPQPYSTVTKIEDPEFPYTPDTLCSSLPISKAHDSLRLHTWLKWTVLIVNILVQSVIWT